MSPGDSVQEDWRPSATIEVLIERARTLEMVRRHFRQRGVLEVDTPVLSRTTVTDPAIESLYVGDVDVRYLQTSPEYQMKRLLAAGAPSIVRIGPVFRAEESGRLHNPEFTMVEWYRLGFDLPALIDDVRALVDCVLGAGEYRCTTYRELLQNFAGVDPFAVDEGTIAAALRRNGVELSPNAEWTRRDAMDLLASRAIDALGRGRTFVCAYPPDQAALARVTESADGEWVAQRFELIIDGIEIANGYDELVDSDALRRRMAADIGIRTRAGRRAPPPDERLLAAMQHGLPACSGVALGFDRLLMLKLGLSRIESVLPFADSCA